MNPIPVVHKPPPFIERLDMWWDWVRATTTTAATTTTDGAVTEVLIALARHNMTPPEPIPDHEPGTLATLRKAHGGERYTAFRLVNSQWQVLLPYGYTERLEDWQVADVQPITQEKSQP